MTHLDPVAADRVKSAVPIDRIVGQYVRLRKSGTHDYKGCCPFHKERTPSFNVNTRTGAYKCFGCGASGDVITFVRRIEGWTFEQAMTHLASEAGLDLRKAGKRDRDDAVARRRLLAEQQKCSRMFWSWAIIHYTAWVELCGRVHEFVCEWWISQEFDEDIADDMEILSECALVVGMKSADQVAVIECSSEEHRLRAYLGLPRATRVWWTQRLCHLQIDGLSKWAAAGFIQSGQRVSTETSDQMLLEAFERARWARKWLA